jgi:hypothetical protein
MDATQVMYEAADRAYEEIGEVHGYTGVCRGLTTVAQKLGIDVDWKYFAQRWHDPLSSSEVWGPLVARTATFADMASMLDKCFYGQFGSHRDGYKPGYPYDAILENRWMPGSSHYHDISGRFDWMVNEIAAHLKKERIRKGTQRHRAFLEENAQKILDNAFAKTQQEAQRQLDRIEEDLKALRDLLKHAQVSDLDNQIRLAFLDEAGLAPNEKTSREIAEFMETWAAIAERLRGHIDHLKTKAQELQSHDFLMNRTIQDLAYNDTLRPFLDAVNITYELPEWKRKSLSKAR